MKNRAFTLIEVLIAVLIIGILAAISVVQYRKATERAKAAQAITLLRSVYQYAQLYFLENGQWPFSFSVLSIEIDSSLNDWSISTHAGQASGDRGFNNYVLINRITGPYAGTGFAIYQDMDKLYKKAMKMERIICIEMKRPHAPIKFDKTPGDYCQKIMQGTLLTKAPGDYYYEIPF